MLRRRSRRHAGGPALALVACAVALAACGSGSRPVRASSATTVSGTATPPAAASPGSSAGATTATQPGPKATPTAIPTQHTASKPSRVTASTTGTGHFTVVPGRVAAPGHGRVRTVEVEIEGGVEVDPAGFADFVMDTLNDPRGWGHDGTMTFARTDRRGQIVVRLASPVTSAALCRPLVTYGRLSCSQGQYANLTSYRWFHGQSEFDSLTQYRQYVVDHEVGHVLGHGHLQCAGAGRLAPVMQQQTKRVAPCRPNAWPFP